MVVYGYLRVSTDKQDIDAHRKEIILKHYELGFTEQIEWIEETVSGTTHYKKRKLGCLLEKCNTGDTIITTEISRVGRTVVQCMQFFAAIIDKDVHMYFTKTDLKINDSLESQVLIFGYAIASQIERDLISSRTRSSLEHAKANGVILGRPKDSRSKCKLLKYDDEIKKKYQMGVTQRKLKNEYKCSANTMSRFIKGRSEAWGVD